MKTIGLLGGMSWESTIPYYRLINEGVKARLGGLHSASLVLHSVDFHDIEACQSAGDWDRAGEILAEAAVGLQQAGAEGIVLCTNTGLFSAVRRLACWCLPSSVRCRSLTPRRSTRKTRSTLCSLQDRRQRREDLRQTLLQVGNKGVDQRRARAVERADQADGKRHLDAEAAHHHAAIGIVQGG